MFPYTLIVVLCVYIDGMAFEVKKVIDNNYPFAYITDDYSVNYMTPEWRSYDVAFAQIRAKKLAGKKNVQIDNQIFYPRREWIEAIERDRKLFK